MKNKKKLAIFLIILSVVLVVIGGFSANYLINKHNSVSNCSQGTDSNVYDNEPLNGATVYITPTGECYHSHPCGKGDYREIIFSDAKKRGLRPCQRCYEQ